MKVIKVLLTGLDPKKFWEDEQLEQVYNVKNGDIIEVRYEGDGYYVAHEMYDSADYELVLSENQIAFPVRWTRLAEKMYPDNVKKDGWLWIKKK